MSKTKNRIRIGIADDHPIFRKGLRTILENHKDFEIVGEAANGDDAVGCPLLALDIPLRQRRVANRERGGFGTGPRPVLVAALGIAFAFLLAVTDFLALPAAAVGGLVADFGEAANVTRLQRTGHPQNGTDTRYGGQ